MHYPLVFRRLGYAPFELLDALIPPYTYKSEGLHTKGMQTHSQDQRSHSFGFIRKASHVVFLWAMHYPLFFAAYDMRNLIVPKITNVRNTIYNRNISANTSAAHSFEPPNALAQRFSV